MPENNKKKPDQALVTFNKSGILITNKYGINNCIIFY